MNATFILDRAIERHGGWKRWAAQPCITLEVERLGGLVPWMKGLGRTFQMPTQMIVQPATERVEAVDYPVGGQRVIYDAGVVHAGHEPRPETHHRQRFAGVAKLRRWDELDALYFFGAALSTYLAVPFILRDAQVIATRQWRGLDAVWVRFPATFHTHGPVQGFYFDAEGLLRRHDYHAEILGPLAYGAHFSSDYIDVDGMPIATKRRVFARVLRGPRTVKTPIPVLRADLRPSS